MNEVSLKPVIDELETLFSKFNKALRCTLLLLQMHFVIY